MANKIITLENLTTYDGKIKEFTIAYTDGKIAELVNSAPDTLDTLGELAAALDDNADILDVINTQINNKVSQSDFNTLNTTVTKIIRGEQTVGNAITAETVELAGEATKAHQDGSGNNIVSTYATKSALSSLETTVNTKANQSDFNTFKNGVQKGDVVVGNAINAETAELASEASKAYADGSGNNIASTYATKTALKNVSDQLVFATTTEINALFS